jgi:hypothetical protein
MTSWTPEESLPNIAAMTRSLFEADQKHVLDVVTGQLNRTIREEIVYGLYARIHANVRAMLKLNETSDVQVLAMISRNIMELTLDLKLIDVIPNSLRKILAFVNVQRLKTARTMVAFAQAHPSADIDVTEKKNFITTYAPSVDSEHAILWPDAKASGQGRKIDHWSALDARSRANAIGLADEQRYVEFYSLFSWHVHAGLVATWNFSDVAVRALIFMSWKTTLDCYQETLAFVIKEFKLHAIDGLTNKIDSAIFAPFLKL